MPASTRPTAPASPPFAPRAGAGPATAAPAHGEGPALRGVFERQTRRVGVITPSGNTVVERVTGAVLRDFPDVSAHYSRTPVFGDIDAFPGGYDEAGMLGAARLLAHAHPDVIVWNGSKGLKVGFARDRELCARIEGETGIRTTTSVLALPAALKALGARRLALVSPYDAGYQAKVKTVLRDEGYECVADATFDLADNLSFAAVPLSDIASAMVRMAAARPDAILAYCTNFPAAVVAGEVEAATGVPVLDTSSLGVWAALDRLGLDTAPGRAWGRVFG
jgi:maleate isomerase